MDNTAPAEQEAALEPLRTALFGLWRFGSNALVAWTPSSNGIELLTVPKVRLFSQDTPHRRVFSGNRRMGRQTFQEVAESMNVQPIELRLAATIGDGPGDMPAHAVERVIAPFVVTRTEQRAVLLLDIVGFSLLKPEQQASQLATLEFALNLAAELVSKHAPGLNILRSTTGDGFYVWNAEKGLAADINLFVAMVVFLTYHATLRRTTAVPLAVPTLRVCAGIGSHYTYHQPSRNGRDIGQFIVGEVTIELARLIDAVAPGQIVVGAFNRLDDSSSRQLATRAFITEVLAATKWMIGMALPGGRIEHMAFYLTGPRGDDGQFTDLRLTVTDKHGLSHDCYNFKLNLFPAGGAPIYCGLQHADLTAPRGNAAN